MVARCWWGRAFLTFSSGMQLGLPLTLRLGVGGDGGWTGGVKRKGGGALNIVCGRYTPQIQLYSFTTTTSLESQNNQDTDFILWVKKRVATWRDKPRVRRGNESQNPPNFAFLRGKKGKLKNIPKIKKDIFIVMPLLWCIHLTNIYWTHSLCQIIKGNLFWMAGEFHVDGCFFCLFVLCCVGRWLLAGWGWNRNQALRHLVWMLKHYPLFTVISLLTLENMVEKTSLPYRSSWSDASPQTHVFWVSFNSRTWCT